MPDIQAARGTLVDIDAIPAAAWAGLAGRALEPNVFYDPNWARAVAAHARGHSGAKALLAWDSPAHRRLIGLLPVVSAWQVLKLPIPMLVAWQAYAPLTTPLLDRDAADEAARGLLDAAAEADARALLLRHVPATGAAATALRRALAERGNAPHIVRRYQRSRLNASDDPDSTLHAALGGRKLKELRRQRKRLSDSGAVSFELASKPETVAAALENFLTLEASGWKGRRGTALGRYAGDAAFIRQAASTLAPDGRFEVATLSCAGAPIAAGLVLRQSRRAFFYKIAYDEIWAKASPGVQLTLELTRHLCADPSIDDVDSMADTAHPMIDRVWSERREMADVLIATRAGDPAIALLRHMLSARETAYGIARRLRGFYEQR